MKMILKLFALPLVLVIKLLCGIGNLLTNVSSYVIGLLLLVLVGCGIFCIVQGKWTELAILAGMGVAAFVALFAMVFLVVKAETLNQRLGDFIRS